MEAPKVFDNLIEATKIDNLGKNIKMSDQADSFSNKNAKGTISTMTFSEISARAKAFAQRTNNVSKLAL